MASKFSLSEVAETSKRKRWNGLIWSQLHDGSLFLVSLTTLLRLLHSLYRVTSNTQTHYDSKRVIELFLTSVQLSVFSLRLTEIRVASSYIVGDLKASWRTDRIPSVASLIFVRQKSEIHFKNFHLLTWIVASYVYETCEIKSGFHVGECFKRYHICEKLCVVIIFFF